MKLQLITFKFLSKMSHLFIVDQFITLIPNTVFYSLFNDGSIIVLLFIENFCLTIRVELKSTSQN